MIKTSNDHVPQHIEETVHAIARLNARHHLSSTASQRFIERATSWLGRPAFLGLLLLAIAVWIAGNAMMKHYFGGVADLPPFPWLEEGLTLLALMLAILILSTQRHDDELANSRDQMTLELAILTEQKVTKLIELIEELRRDSPEVKDRIDSEASEMAAHADPHDVLGAIEKTNEEIIASAKSRVCRQ
jgi:uncharacterized membrane protein